MSPLIVSVAAGLAALIITSLRVLREYERGVVFRLGRFAGVKGPGRDLLNGITGQRNQISARRPGDQGCGG